MRHLTQAKQLKLLNFNGIIEGSSKCFVSEESGNGHAV